MTGQEVTASPEDVRAWQEMMGWNDATARERLGIGSQNTWRRYREEGAPLTVALAMQALARGTQAWGATSTTRIARIIKGTATLEVDRTTIGDVEFEILPIQPSTGRSKPLAQGTLYSTGAIVKRLFAARESALISPDTGRRIRISATAYEGNEPAESASAAFVVLARQADWP